MKRIRIFLRIMKQTGAMKVIWTYIAFIFIAAYLILITDPEITHYGDAIWYCYAVIFTDGFGDVVVSSFLPKLLSLAVSIYSVIIIAIFTGLIVQFYNELIAAKNNETLQAFLDELEHLPELSEEELNDISNRVKYFRESGKNR